MAFPLHIPALQAGEIVTGSDSVDVRATGSSREPFARITRLPPERILRSLPDQPGHEEAFAALDTPKILRCLRSAADFFLSAPLPPATGAQKDWQGPEDYLDCVQKTTGLPREICRQNQETLADLMRGMADILKEGLPGVLAGPLAGVPGDEHRFVHRSRSPLRVILPGDLPLLNALWLPALCLRSAVHLHPSPEDPWTPWRLIQSLISAGVPSRVFHFSAGNPRDILQLCRHPGPCLSPEDFRRPFHAVFLSESGLDDWQANLDYLAENLLQNAARAPWRPRLVVVPKRADDVAWGLSRKFEKMADGHWQQLLGDLPAGRIPGAARFLRQVRDLIEQTGAQDISTKTFRAPLLQKLDGKARLLPVVLRVPDLRHPLVQARHDFPVLLVAQSHTPRPVLPVLPEGARVTVIGYNEDELSVMRQASAIRELHIGRAARRPDPLAPPGLAGICEKLLSPRDQTVATDV